MPRKRGAAEHVAKKCEWRVGLAYTNIGLPGKAFEGKDWPKHRRTLWELFTNLLKEEGPIVGLLLNEVGNLDDLLSKEGKQRLEDVVVEAFDTVGAPGHGGPQFFWSEGETMTAFRAETTCHDAQGGPLASR